MLTKSVHLLVTDLHLRAKNFPNRLDYEAECLYVMRELTNLIHQYKRAGYKVTLVFMGDVVHNSFHEIEDSLSWTTRLIKLIMFCDECYTLLGNHEKSYGRNNPFWSLLETIDSPKVRSLPKSKVWRPIGDYNFTKIVDFYSDGNVNFFFNHHACGIANPPNTGNINIGLFHQDIHSTSMILDAKVNYDVDVFKHKAVDLDKDNTAFEGYQYVFLGHQHWNYGKWLYTNDITGRKCVVYNLGSLGRTNHKEVNDKFLDRIIPAVILEDGQFKEIVDHPIKLWSRELTVKEDIVEKEQKKRKDYKERVAAREYIRLNSDPVSNLREKFNGEETPVYASLFEEAVKGNLLAVEEAILRGEEIL